MRRARWTLVLSAIAAALASEAAAQAWEPVLSSRPSWRGDTSSRGGFGPPPLPRFVVPGGQPNPHDQPQAAEAPPPAGSPPEMQPVNGDTFATNDEAKAAVGDGAAAVQCPSRGQLATGADWHARSVRVTLRDAGDGYRGAGVVNTLLKNALSMAWAQCPLIRNSPDGSRTFEYGVAAVDIFAPSEPGTDPAEVYHAETFTEGAQWAAVSDIGLAREREAAAATVPSSTPSAQPTDAAEPPPPVVALAPVATTSVEPPLLSAATKRVVWTWLKGFALACFVVWVVAYRRSIATWYYFAFHPHPAEPLVQRALSSDVTSASTAHALAQALGQMPPGSSTLRAVRLQQADRLFGQLHDASVARQRAIERKMREGAARAREEAAFVSLQEAVALAAVALEHAKAAYDTARHLQGSALR